MGVWKFYDKMEAVKIIGKKKNVFSEFLFHPSCVLFEKFTHFQFVWRVDSDLILEHLWSSELFDFCEYIKIAK